MKFNINLIGMEPDVQYSAETTGSLEHSAEAFHKKFTEIVDNIINPSRNKNTAWFHPCCRSFNKRCRAKDLTHDPLYPFNQHELSFNLTAIFKLGKAELTTAQAWQQFVEWTEKAGIEIMVGVGFTINQRICRYKVDAATK